MSKRKPYQNKSGLSDFTPYEALANIVRDERRALASEAAEQTAVFDWKAVSEKRYPDLWFLHAVPNGGSRHPAEAANLKRQGVKAGVSDISFPVPRRGFNGLYIEMKSKAGRISDAQSEWINRIRTKCYAAYVCRGADEAIKLLEWYLSEK